VLSAHNGTVAALRGTFAGSLPIWEGHVRVGLQELVIALESHSGDPNGISVAAVEFLQRVATGFTSSGYGDILIREVRTGCSSLRNGKPAKIQRLAKTLLSNPNQTGLSMLLRGLHTLIESDRDFSTIRIDASREFWDAVGLAQFHDLKEGLGELARRRSSVAQLLPQKAISTVHKAKGMECSDVLVIPCDRHHFGKSDSARCTLYVAMSRATRSLTFVVSRANPSPLVLI
jgi:hypothetical protein